MNYIIIKDGNINIKQTDNFDFVLNYEFQKGNDSTDYVFKEDKEIRVFVENSSLYEKPPTLAISKDEELLYDYHGTIIFAKNGRTKYRGLSKENIKLIQNRLTRINDSKFRLSI